MSLCIFKQITHFDELEKDLNQTENRFGHGDKTANQIIT